MTKIESLKTQLTDILMTELRAAGQWRWYYKFECPNEVQFERWAAYSNEGIRKVKALQAMDIEDFRKVLHNRYVQKLLGWQ